MSKHKEPLQLQRGWRPSLSLSPSLTRLSSFLCCLPPCGGGSRGNAQHHCCTDAKSGSPGARWPLSGVMEVTRGRSARPSNWVGRRCSVLLGQTVSYFFSTPGSQRAHLRTSRLVNSAHTHIHTHSLLLSCDPCCCPMLQLWRFQQLSCSLSVSLRVFICFSFSTNH